MKNKIINEIIGVEGGYINHPSDKGGQTNYGITEKVQRENGYKGDMKDLPKDLQLQIYQKKYWDVNRLDDIQKISEKVQEEVQDTGVNQGTGTQAKMLQRALNVLNLQGKVYPDLVVDGQIGTKSIQALQKYFDHRKENQEIVLLRILNSLQGQHYVQIQESREQNEDFIFGWFLHRVKL